MERQIPPLTWQSLSTEEKYILSVDDVDDANAYAERVCSGQFPVETTREAAIRYGAADYLAGIKHYKMQRNEIVLDAYRSLKDLLGVLGFNNVINSKEVEEYRKWLREGKYKHRIDWFEKEYPNGIFTRDDDGTEHGINIITKQFLAESDASLENSNQ